MTMNHLAEAAVSHRQTVLHEGVYVLPVVELVAAAATTTIDHQHLVNCSMINYAIWLPRKSGMATNVVITLVTIPEDLHHHHHR